MTKSVTKKSANTPAVYGDERPSYLKDGERGSEDVTRDDITIPRLGLIQDLSPQRKKNNPEYIEGAEEGMLFNTVTGKLYGDEVLFVPVMFRKEHIIWKDRKAGGGFRGVFASEHEATAAMNELEDGNQCEVVATAQHFGLLIHPESTTENPIVEEIVISMAKSKMKVSRTLNSMVRLIGGDRFSRIYKINSTTESNEKGEFFGLSVKSIGYVTEAIYKAAESLYESVKSGERDVNRDDETISSSTEDGNREF